MTLSIPHNKLTYFTLCINCSGLCLLLSSLCVSVSGLALEYGLEHFNLSQFHFAGTQVFISHTCFPFFIQTVALDTGHRTQSCLCVSFPSQSLQICSAFSIISLSAWSWIHSPALVDLMFFVVSCQYLLRSWLYYAAHMQVPVLYPASRNGCRALHTVMHVRITLLVSYRRFTQCLLLHYLSLSMFQGSSTCVGGFSAHKCSKSVSGMFIVVLVTPRSQTCSTGIMSYIFCQLCVASHGVFQFMVLVSKSVCVCLYNSFTGQSLGSFRSMLCGPPAHVCNLQVRASLPCRDWTTSGMCIYATASAGPAQWAPCLASHWVYIGRVANLLSLSIIQRFVHI